MLVKVANKGTQTVVSALISRPESCLTNSTGP